MKNLKRLSALLLAACVALSSVPVTAADIYSPTNKGNSVHTSGGVTVTENEDPDTVLAHGSDDSLLLPDAQVDPDTIVRAIIVFEEKSLLDKGFTADDIAENGEKVISAYNAIDIAQSNMIGKITSAVNKSMSKNGIATISQTPVEVNYRYSVLFNGLSVDVPYGALADIRQLDGVADAFVASRYNVPEDVSGTAQPFTYASGGMIGSHEAWDAGYKGDGMRIAIIDTGLDIDHPSFAGDLPDNENYLTKDEVSSVCGELNATNGYAGKKGNKRLTADDLYISEKIPYAYCYVDGDTDVTHQDGQGDHGTHVAGITAANEIEGTNVVGVAPNAQILVMKVFGDQGGAYQDDIAAALEDCFRLGADAVNMSLGSNAGFSTAGNKWEDDIYAKVAEHGMILAVAAGNATSAALNNASGTNKNLTSDPDNSIISSPATYAGATAVASNNNTMQAAAYFMLGKEKIVFSDVSAIPFSSLTYGEESAELEYAVIPGAGSEADFADAGDIYGKIALVQRGGGTDFVTKQTNAANAGAVGIIVYDNVEGALMNMMDAEMIPNIFISLESGEKMKAAADENGIGTITVLADDQTFVPTADAGKMSDFSSWGLSPDLTLTPDITAPGGNIYSTLDGGNYGDMSGTSMASPHIAGMSALVLQYLREKYPSMKESEIHTVAEALLMSTATPIIEDDENNIPYSPRWQGAGLANVYKAVTSPVYLTVKKGDELTPKASLGDSETGVYSFTFTLNNLTAEEHTYTLGSTLLTDQYITVDGKKYMGETSRLLTDSEVKFSKDSVTVPANGSVSVDVTITLGANDKAYMEDNYENGIYVDGFVSLKSSDKDGVDLGLPMAGFYGDWSEAPVFDTGWWYEDEETMEYNRYPNVVFTDVSLLGINPYTDTEYDPAHNVVSPNGDGYIDGLSDIYASLMRNAKELSFTWTDASGKVLYKVDYPHAVKSYYSEAYGICMPFQFSSIEYYGLGEMYDFSGLKNNDKVTLTVSAKLDDGDEVVDDSFEVPITVDTEKPSIIEAVQDGNTLTLTVSDNQYIAAVIPITKDGNALEYYTVENEPNGSAQVVIDTTGFDSVFQVAVCDYGCNEKYYTVALNRPATFDENSWYAFRQISWGDPGYGYLVNTDVYNGWWTFKDTAEDMTWRYADQPIVNAAEYVDGFIIGVDEMGDVFAIRPGSWERLDLGWLTYEDYYLTALDMTLDYQNKTLYLLASTDTGAQLLLTMDPNSGEITDAVEITGAETELLALAADESGNLYTVDTDAENASLYKLDAETGAVTKVGDTGVATGVIVEDSEYDEEIGDWVMVEALQGFYQSMGFDHKEKQLYWATYRSETDPMTYAENPMAGFYKVNTDSGKAEKVSDVMDYAELTALFKPSSECPDVIKDVDAEFITLSEENIIMLAGQEAILNVIPDPVFADISDVQWSSSDTSVVTVEKGLVTAKAEGYAVVTAKLGNLTAECYFRVIDPKGDLRLFDASGYYQFIKVDASDASASVMFDSISPSYAITAAAYRDGKVYAYDAGGSYYKLDADTMNGVKVGNAEPMITAMAFNYADGFMYGIKETTVGSMWERITTYELVKINVNNGKTQTVSQIDTSVIGQPSYGMAIDYSGNFYFVSINDFYELQMVKAELNDGEFNVTDSAPIPVEIGPAGYASLVYSDANDALFWANDWGQLVWIDAETFDSVYIGGILQMELEGMAMNMGLLEIVENEPDVPDVKATDASMPELIQVLAGGKAAVSVDVEPWNSSSTITYEIADTSLATVSEDGVISGLKPGKTTLTVKVGDITLTAEVKVLPPAGNLYGNILQDYSGSPYGLWISFSDIDPMMADVVNQDLFETETSVFAGAYYDGKIYAYVQDADENEEYYTYLMTFDTEADFTAETLGRITYSIRDMAFDYTRGTLFAVESGGKLLEIDTETGDVTVVGDTDLTLVAVACDDKGQLYAVSEEGTLYKLSSDTADAEEVGPTGLTNCTGLQSMHFDTNTGNTYWTYTDVDSVTGGLYLVDLETGTATELGMVAGGSIVTSLYTVPGEAPVIPENVEPEGVVFDKDTEVVPVGEKAELNATVLPVSVSSVDDTLVWTSSDTSIVTVNENGVVTGVAPGVATVTVTDSKGHTATITIIVPSVKRKVFAYDETNAQWVSFDESGVPTTVRKDAEGEELLKASYYVQSEDVIYAYGVDGGFYSIDPYTFERTKLGQVEFGAYESWDGESYPVTPVDMAYNAENGKMYLAANAMTVSEYGFYCAYSFLYEVDVTTGELTVITESEELAFSNLVVIDGQLYAVNAFDTGMFTAIDVETGELTSVALVQGYWSEPSSSRSFFVDEMTGLIYAVRDFAGGGIYGNGDTPEPYLYLFDVNDASLTTVYAMGDAYYNGVFVREPVEEPIMPDWKKPVEPTPNPPTPPTPSEPEPEPPAPDEPDDNPNTANGLPVFWASAMAASAVGMFVLSPKMKKRSKK